ncbi:arginyltransferase [Simiduia agarivorans]|uniref:Aspartate/glutamate leucyltransferase n=1 Tax=Simiduia agarivorans (strain DSM 21679 / JCM 13881 / BCRC 17597 / SA1) TaxID=1117647 RepID=K4KFI1_SIMAS|nr:arginyltransferase [Simiduia agarivorans]AFU97834.1 arginyl-tRNA-protein transferase [Simiduia agarivorans SA1 = DSM 21679]
MSSSVNLKLFATHPHACSYLDEREATTVFIDPDAKVDKSLYSRLSALGFRRSGQHVYRPHCAQCNACIPMRIPVTQFSPSRSQRRVLKRNQDLRLEVLESGDSDEFYALYARYIAARHKDGDMYPPSRSQYDGFLTSQWQITRFLAAYLDDQLVGVAVCDLLDEGLSAVYTFFDPELDQRSLGTWFILQQLRWVGHLGLPYLYLGYWINACDKMSYKAKFQPQQRLIDGVWVFS